MSTISQFDLFNALTGPPNVAADDIVAVGDDAGDDAGAVVLAMDSVDSTTPLASSPASSAVTLTTEQNAAVEAVLDDPGLVSVLVGPAGSGKSTVLNEIIRRAAPRYRGGIVLLAPTGKAAARMAEIVRVGEGVAASIPTTIHRSIYGYVSSIAKLVTEYTRAGEGGEGWYTTSYSADGSVVDVEPADDEEIWEAKNSDGRWSRPPNKRGSKLLFGKPHAPCGNHSLVVIDEASMVSEFLHLDLLKQMKGLVGCKVIYIGDREQLPPVNARPGPDLFRPTGALTQVHRQALNNPILRVATDIRNRLGALPDLIRPTDGPLLTKYQQTSLEAPAQWLAAKRAAGEDATLICYTNKARSTLNYRVRALRGLDVMKPINVGDYLLIRANNTHYGLNNGEVFRVIDAHTDGATIRVQLDGRDGHFFVVPHLIGGEVNDFRNHVGKKTDDRTTRTIHVDYGEALTCHASQGSQWKSVGVVWEGFMWVLKNQDPDTFRRWSYTAITRAQESASVFMLAKGAT